jgi:hypothetical protein
MGNVLVSLCLSVFRRNVFTMFSSISALDVPSSVGCAPAQALRTPPPGERGRRHSRCFGKRPVMQSILFTIHIMLPCSCVFPLICGGGGGGGDGPVIVCFV